MFHGPLRQVDPVQICPDFGKPLMIRPQTHADLEHA
jgi:hypothetical protein